MRLFAVSFWIALRHSGKRLLCLFCVAGACAGLVWAALSALPEENRPRASVAIVNLDQNPLSAVALKSAATQEHLSELLEVRFLEPSADTRGYTAVVTIPDGFLASVMNGENRSPLVEVDVTTPLEAILVRQLARAGAQWLTAAQRGIYTVQEGMDYGETLTEREYGFLLADVNLTFLRAFSERLSAVSAETLSASGALSLPLYYLSALIGVLLFCYGFFCQPSVENLRRFCRTLPVGKSGTGAALAVPAHLFTLCAAAVLPLWAVCGASYGFTAERLAAALLLALLMGAFALTMALLLRDRAACAAGCVLLSLGMGVCSGAVLPLALMPPVFAKIAPLTVTGQGRRLVAALLGEPLSAPWQPVLPACALLALCALLWKFDRREVGG